MKTWALFPTVISSAILLVGLIQSELSVAAPCSGISFVPVGPFGPSNGRSVVVGDFNRDGNLDLAVAQGIKGELSVLLGNGKGAFGAAVNYGAGVNPIVNPVFVAVGDFNSDTNLDLAVADASSDTVWVLLGKGNGTFQAAVSYAAGITPWSVAVGDFNLDGKSDLAVANSLSDDVSVLSGIGNGTFRAAANYDVGVNPRSVAVGDFNGDNRRDLAVANAAVFGGDDPPSLSVLLVKANGTFNNATTNAAGASPRSVAVGDFNHDGNLDLAVANYGTNDESGVVTNSSVSVLLGNGNGTFGTAVKYGAGSGPVSVAVADFDKDGNLDLVVANNRSANVSVLLGNGNGTFLKAVNFGAGNNPFSVAAGDFNGDGFADLAVVNDANVLVLLNTCANPPVDLEIVRKNTFVTVSWPYPSTDFILESKISLSLVNWPPVNAAAITNNGRWEVTVPLDQQGRYFRLHKP